MIFKIFCCKYLLFKGIIKCEKYEISCLIKPFPLKMILNAVIFMCETKEEI